MSELTVSQPMLDMTEEDEATLEAYWAEMQRLREQIDADQAEIESLKAETRAMLTLLKSTVEA